MTTVSMESAASQLADFTANFVHPTTDRSTAPLLFEKGKPSRALSAQGPTKAMGVVLLLENQPECLIPSIPAPRGGSGTKKFSFDLNLLLNGAQGSHLLDLLTSNSLIRLIIAKNGLRGRVWLPDLSLWKQAMLLVAPALTRPTKQALAQVPKWKCLHELEWILHQSQTACAHLHSPGSFEALSCKGTADESAELASTLDTIITFWLI